VPCTVAYVLSHTDPPTTLLLRSIEYLSPDPVLEQGRQVPAPVLPVPVPALLALPV